MLFRSVKFRVERSEVSLFSDGDGSRFNRSRRCLSVNWSIKFLFPRYDEWKRIYGVSRLCVWTVESFGRFWRGAVVWICRCDANAIANGGAIHSIHSNDPLFIDIGGLERIGEKIGEASCCLR